MLSGKCERLLTGWAVAAAGFTADALLAQSAKHQAPVEVTTPSVPIPVTADGKQFLVYELHVTNFGTTPLALRSVEVYAGGATASLITTLRDSALHAAVRVIGAPTSMNGGAMTTRITRLNGEVQQHWPPYEIVIVGLSGRQFTTSGGVAVRATVLPDPSSRWILSSCRVAQDFVVLASPTRRRRGSGRRRHARAAWRACARESTGSHRPDYSTVAA